MFSFKYLTMDCSHNYVEKPLEDSCSECRSHYHEDVYEIYLYVRGSVKMIVENSEKVLEEGDLVVIPPYSLHRVEILDDSPYEYIDFKLPSVFVFQYIARKLKEYGAFFKMPDPKFRLMDSPEKIDRICEEYTREGISDEMSYFSMGNWLNTILVYLVRKDEGSKDTGTENALVREMVEYINANLTKKITMDDLCNRFHRSSSYLRKQFAAVYSEPVMTYIRNRRMKLAAYLISNGSKPTEVAKLLGYTDYYPFYKAYVSVNGEMPTAKKEE